MLGTPDEDVYVNCQEAAYVIEKLQKKVSKLEVDRLYMETASKNDTHRIAELEHQLKVECDAFLWKRKLMSRRIASLQYWMKKLFQYGSSPEAKRNQMTMTTEIPDYLMREGEDILRDERSDLEEDK
jgi:anion-transporting  ArsA/GET3 family ATPase